MHIVLLGDSIFDNGAYVRRGEPDVVRQLRARLPAGARATLAAVDGATAADVRRQLERLPADATHLDRQRRRQRRARQYRRARRARALDRRRVDAPRRHRRRFRARLSRHARSVLDRGRPTALCTIYEPRYPDPRFQRLAVTGLVLFNDVITRAAFAHGLPVLDLRLICDEDADFANPIEPSAQGGDKIAAAIARLVAEHDFARRRSEVFVR